MFDVHFSVNPSSGQPHFLFMMNPTPLAEMLTPETYTISFFDTLPARIGSFGLGL